MTCISLNTDLGEVLNEANHFTDKDMRDVYVKAIENNLTEGDDDKATLVRVLLEKRKNILEFLNEFELKVKHSNKDLTGEAEDYMIEGKKLAQGLKKNKWDLGEAYVAIEAWRKNLNTVIQKEAKDYKGNEEVYLRCQNCLKHTYDDLKILTVSFVEIDAISQMIKQM
jgi:hypothetical protein